MTSLSCGCSQGGFDLNYATKLEVLERADQRRKGISDSKGPEYAGSGAQYLDENSDVLANFKRNAGRTGADVLTVWAVYFGKHLDSIETFIREWAAAETDEERQALVSRGEGIISRFDDARNYLDLGECILHEAGFHPESACPPHMNVAAVGETLWCNDCGERLERETAWPM